ncbi:CLUMA_CG020412, isoform A [Clunio marinus]|uniref:CLUMA_CG020412, isoform A n=1 Tax=Clunio marinus TaxID=568069 RepID=A0A1J1J4V8_9DIPT|nr:CLUMA_CG020412, isoform A [Clunio marinus]
MMMMMTLEGRSEDHILERALTEKLHKSQDLEVPTKGWNDVIGNHASTMRKFPLETESFTDAFKDQNI